LDSDGDGFTNGTELQDPQGSWTIGSPKPGDAGKVSNPGVKTSIPTSVDYDNEFNSLSIYPNPASDYIEIQVKPSEGFEPSEGYKIHIFNTLGIEVAQSSLIVNPNNTNGQGGMLNLLNIDISHLPAGAYFIKIGERVEKFVKK
jgi:hypothetical protein